MNFFFPPLCFHCDTLMKRSGQLFCSGCAKDFELATIEGRCRYCFSEVEGGGICRFCLLGKRWHVKMAAAVDYQGATATLVKLLKGGKIPYLAESAAAFMLIQWERLKWPLPDAVVPIPSRFLFWKINHAELIARHVARMLNVPLRKVIGRFPGDRSQTSLRKEEREHVLQESFYPKKKKWIKKKTLLLIDDVITTGSTMRFASAALLEEAPKSLFALAFAKTPYR